MIESSRTRSYAAAAASAGLNCAIRATSTSKAGSVEQSIIRCKRVWNLQNCRSWIGVEKHSLQLVWGILLSKTRMRHERSLLVFCLYEQQSIFFILDDMPWITFTVTAISWKRTTIQMLINNSSCRKNYSCCCSSIKWSCWQVPA